jgi:cytochrome c oxidase accessory protein FixG
MCVQVCPTGIDIRNGLQYECISCAACIDACDSIMDQMNYPRGLIRYSTENVVEGKPGKILRPRLIGYGVALAAMVVLFLSTVFSRVPLELDIIRDRSALYRENFEGHIENTYTLKVMNKTQDAQEYTITVSGLDNVIPHIPEHVETLPGELLTLAVTLEMKPEDMQQRNSTVYFTVKSLTDPSQEVTEESRFLGPRN